jgi:hypothetical protein
MNERNEWWRTTAMAKHVLLLTLAAGLCAGASCTIQFADTNPPDNSGDGTSAYVSLDKASAVIAISQIQGEADADATLRIADRGGHAVVLQQGQAVSINGQAFGSPDNAGYYQRTISIAENYTVTVNEPTRGVVDTAIGSPAGFAIAAPAPSAAVSLSGFTLTWTNPDVRFRVTLTLQQAEFGHPSQRFGPFDDTGSHTFDAADLIDFRQGADLSITVTRTSALRSVAGFGSADFTVDHADTVAATPSP